MRVLVWGLGHVGTVNAACLAELGHEVIGIDRRPEAVDALLGTLPLMQEPGLRDLVERNVAAGRLRAVREGAREVRTAEVSLVCVGIPASPEGGLVLDQLLSVASEIGRGLRAESPSRHVVALRSTVVPGMTRGVFREALETASGKSAGSDFGLACHPEFLREGNAVTDYQDPPLVLVGALDEDSARRLESMSAGLGRPVRRVSIEEAELIKLASNAFHALKIGFANEIGRLCGTLDIDPEKVMQTVRADTKLNASSAYLTPGFAFGGSCLPKDIRLLLSESAQRNVPLPILQSVLPSNDLHLEAACRRVLDLRVRRVGVVGLAFKPGTDDFRESPGLALAAALRQRGIHVLVHDPDVRLASLSPASRLHLEARLPDFPRLFCENLADLLRRSDAIVLTQNRPGIAEAVNRAGYAGRLVKF